MGRGGGPALQKLKGHMSLKYSLCTSYISEIPHGMQMGKCPAEAAGIHSLWTPSSHSRHSHQQAVLFLLGLQFIECHSG